MTDNPAYKNLIPKRIQQIAISVTTLTVAVIFLAILVSCDPKQTDSTPPPLPSSVILSDPTQTQLQKCTLFFFDTNSLRLAGEERELDLPQDVTQRLKQIIAELLGTSINGLHQTIPKDTLLYEVYFDGDSTAYLDFSRHLKDEHIGSTTSEALTVGAILRTVKMNFPDEIRKVQILIEGLETDTIGGHIDIAKPLDLLLELEVMSRVTEPTEAESTEVETLEADQASEQAIGQ